MGSMDYVQDKPWNFVSVRSGNISSKHGGGTSIPGIIIAKIPLKLGKEH